MTIIPRLFQAYKNAGYDVFTGYNSYHMYNWMDAPFTMMAKDGQLFGFPGLALQEVMFLENFGDFMAPKNCFIIGNSFGWSTVSVGLTFPQAKTIAMDMEPDPHGREMTNRIFADLNLDGGAVLGKSPDDVEPVCQEHFSGLLDFILIDAEHTNEAVLQDFSAVAPLASPNCVFVFHDVLNWKNLPAFKAIIDETGMVGHVLTRTPSGMAIAYRKGAISDEFQSYIDAFTDRPDAFRAYRELARKKMEPVDDLDRYLF